MSFASEYPVRKCLPHSTQAKCWRQRNTICVSYFLSAPVVCFVLIGGSDVHAFLVLWTLRRQETVAVSFSSFPNFSLKADRQTGKVFCWIAVWLDSCYLDIGHLKSSSPVLWTFCKSNLCSQHLLRSLINSILCLWSCVLPIRSLKETPEDKRKHSWLHRFERESRGLKLVFVNQNQQLLFPQWE